MTLNQARKLFPSYKKRQFKRAQMAAYPVGGELRFQSCKQAFGVSFSRCRLDVLRKREHFLNQQLLLGVHTSVGDDTPGDLATQLL